MDIYTKTLPKPMLAWHLLLIEINSKLSSQNNLTMALNAYFSLGMVDIASNLNELTFMIYITIFLQVPSSRPLY